MLFIWLIEYIFLFIQLSVVILTPWIDAFLQPRNAPDFLNRLHEWRRGALELAGPLHIHVFYTFFVFAAGDEFDLQTENMKC